MGVKRVKLMRGVEASRLSATPVQGEPITTTDELKLYLGDGDKAGGFTVNADNTIAVWPDQTDATKKLSLAWWIAHFNGEEATIRIPRGTHEVLYDMTIPENICLKFDRGAILEVASDKTLTINGSIEAGLYQIFTATSDLTGNPKTEASYPEWFGAVGDNATDDSDAVVKWGITWNCTKKANSSATYKCQKEVKFNGSIVDCCNATFDFTDAPAENFTKQSCFLFEGGDFVELPALGVNIAPMSDVINVTSDPTLLPLDIVVLYDSADGSFNKAHAGYHAGEYCKVFYVEANTISGYDIKLTERTYTEYSAGSTVKLYKMNNPVIVKLCNVHIKSTLNGVVRCLTIYRGYHCIIDNIRAEQSSYMGVSLTNCYECTVINSHFTKINPDTSGTSYGLGIGNSQKISVSNCFALAIRSAITTGGGEQLCCVPCREIKITNCTLTTLNGIAAIGTHGNIENFDFSHNTLKGGITVGGNNGIISNNQMRDGGAYTGSIYFAQCIGTNFLIENNIYTSNQTPAKSRGIFLDQGGDGAIFVNGQVSAGGTLIIRGNVIQYGLLATERQGYGAICVYNRAISHLSPFTLVVENNSIQAPSYLSQLAVAASIHISDTANTLYKVTIQNNTMIGSGMVIRSVGNVTIKNNSIMYAGNVGIFIAKQSALNLFTKGDVIIEGNYINGAKSTGILIGGVAEYAYDNVNVIGNIVKNSNQLSTGATRTDTPLNITHCTLANVYNNDLGAEAGVNQQRQAAYYNIDTLSEKANDYKGPGVIFYDASVITKYGQSQAAIADDTASVTVAKFNEVLAALRNHKIIKEA